MGGGGGAPDRARGVFVLEVGGVGGDGVSRHLQVSTTRILFYISPQEREIGVPILSRSRAHVQNVRSRVPKTRERRNAKPRTCAHLCK